MLPKLMPPWVLQFAQAVDGPGPIAVTSGQALLVTVEFTCPADPPSGKFQGTVAMHGFAASVSLPILATASLGRLEVFELDTPPTRPGQKVTFGFASTRPCMAFTNFDVEVSPTAPPGRLSPLAIFWTVTEPEITGQRVFNIEIVADQAVLALPQPLSQLSQENDPKPIVCDRAVLTICNSGSWNLTAHFENQETLEDVNFVFEAGLRLANARLSSCRHLPAQRHLCSLSKSDVLGERQNLRAPVPAAGRVWRAGRRQYSGSAGRSRSVAMNETLRMPNNSMAECIRDTRREPHAPRVAPPPTGWSHGLGTRRTALLATLANLAELVSARAHRKIANLILWPAARR